MEEAHKKIIRENYMELLNQFATDIDRVCNVLFQSKIISERMKEDIIEGNRTKSKKAEACLDLIVRRGPYAFDALYRAALDSELYAAADILRPENGPHHDIAQGFNPSKNARERGIEQGDAARSENETQDDGPKDAAQQFDIKLPDEWPSKELIDINKIKVTSVIRGSAMETDYWSSLKPLGQTFWYVMRNRCRGRALIINNETFIKELPAGSPTTEAHQEVVFLRERKGSSLDRDSLKTLFSQLGYNPIVYNDKTASEMRAIFDTESKLDHSKFDSFVLFILSHGAKGKVCGSDGYFVKTGSKGEEKAENCVQTKKIIDQFCNAPSLRGKPKLFFIQACRGGNKDPGQPVETAQENTLDSPETDEQLERNLADAQETLQQFEMEEADTHNIPSQADYFIAMATVSGMVSWRHANYGSWFIQAIVYIFYNHAHNFDLHKLMTLVNMLVTKAETRSGFKQVAQKKDTLSKTFCFFPGLYPEMEQRPYKN